MPKIFYTEDEYESLKHENKRLQQQVEGLQAMRPMWAQGYTSDSIAAQASAGALHQIWRALGAQHQTQAMQIIQHLKKVNAPES